MKRYLTLGIVGVLLLGAAATVSREEFDELRGRVAILEGRLKRMEAQLETLQDVKVHEAMGVESKAEADTNKTDEAKALVIADLPNLRTYHGWTDAQQKQWHESVKGQRFSGHAIVEDVGFSTHTSTYGVRIQRWGTQDAAFTVSLGPMVDPALSAVTKQMRIEFTGIIEKVWIEGRDSLVGRNRPNVLYGFTLRDTEVTWPGKPATSPAGKPAK